MWIRRQKPAHRDDHAEAEEGEREPAGGLVAALAIAREGEQRQQDEGDAGENRERGYDRVQDEPLSVDAGRNIDLSQFLGETVTIPS
jgi:hypothetical protein